MCYSERMRRLAEIQKSVSVSVAAFRAAFWYGFFWFTPKTMP